MFKVAQGFDQLLSNQLFCLTYYHQRSLGLLVP
jgi:hypothetical protein